MLLTIPKCSSKIRPSYETGESVKLWGTIGEWLARHQKHSATLERHWNPEKPVMSIKGALEEATKTALVQDYVAEILVMNDVDRCGAPERFLDRAQDEIAQGAKVIMALSCENTDILYAPKIEAINAINPAWAKAISGAINSGLAETVGDFGPSRVWYMAEYVFWCGELEIDFRDVESMDEQAQEIMERMGMDDSTPLPSRLLSLIPSYTTDFAGKISAIPDCQQSFPEVYSRYMELVEALKLFRRSQKGRRRTNAWGCLGEFNFEAQSLIGWSPQSKDSCGLNGDIVRRLMDDWYQDMMQGGESSSIMGLGFLNNQKDFAGWLDNLELGGKVFQATIKLLEELA